MPEIIDTADNVTKRLSALRAKGVNSIIRYDCRLIRGQWKQMFQDECSAIAQKGFKIGIVYEGAGATPSAFTQNTGYRDASYSRRMAKARSQPDGSAIYFAVDFDADLTTINQRIVPYFRGVHQAFDEANGNPELVVGAYCSGLVAQSLKTIWPNTLIWITCSLGFRGSRAAVNQGKYDLWQNKCDTSLAGVDCDFDTAKNPNWGWWVPNVPQA